MAELPKPEAPARAPAFLTQPLKDLAAWTRYFHTTEIPVLATTSQAIEALRAVEDEVNPAMLSEVIGADPLMTLKMMAYISGRRRPDEATEIESITSALVMMGVSPFFRHFLRQATVEDRLQSQPLALACLREVLTRVEWAGCFALGFAVHRADMDAAALQLAAFLHDFAELLLWCHAPTLALQIHDAQEADPTLRSADIQRRVLGIQLEDLRQVLMKQWHLPELLVRISDGSHPDDPRVLNVVLAVRLARHTTHGWDNAAVPDDLNDVAALLNTVPRIALAYLHKIERSI